MFVKPITVIFCKSIWIIDVSGAPTRGGDGVGPEALPIALKKIENGWQFSIHL